MAATLKFIDYNVAMTFILLIIIIIIIIMGGLLHLVQRGGAWAGCGPAQSPPRCNKFNSPPINGQCTNFILFDVAL